MAVLPSRAARLQRLRDEVRAIERSGDAAARPALAFGVEAIDDRLADGGLATAALHEAVGDRRGLNDEAAAVLFWAGIAARLSGTVLWTLARRDLFAPALAQAGLDPSRVLYAEAGSDADVLAVMEEGLRHGSLAAVVGEVTRAGMTATRRLQLAAEQGGTTALLLRRWRGEADPLAEPSAAVTRWRIGCAPSAPMPVHNALGRPRWSLGLARQRGGDTHQWIVEGTDAEGRLHLAADTGDRQAAPRRPARRPLARAA